MPAKQKYIKAVITLRMWLDITKLKEMAVA